MYMSTRGKYSGRLLRCLKLAKATVTGYCNFHLDVHAYVSISTSVCTLHTYTYMYYTPAQTNTLSAIVQAPEDVQLWFRWLPSPSSVWFIVVKFPSFKTIRFLQLCLCSVYLPC